MAAKMKILSDFQGEIEQILWIHASVGIGDKSESVETITGRFREFATEINSVKEKEIIILAEEDFDLDEIVNQSQGLTNALKKLDPGVNDIFDLRGIVSGLEGLKPMENFSRNDLDGIVHELRSLDLMAGYQGFEDGVKNFTLDTKNQFNLVQLSAAKSNPKAILEGYLNLFSGFKKQKDLLSELEVVVKELKEQKPGFKPIVLVENLEFRNIIGDVIRLAGINLSGIDLFDLHVFVRDSFVVLGGYDEPVLLKSYYTWSSRDYVTSHQVFVSRYIPEMLSDQKGYSIRASRYNLEGGNIISGGDFVLVGRRIVEDNLSRVQNNRGLTDSSEKKERVLSDLSDLFGVRICACVDFELGKETKEFVLKTFYHLDLFISALGVKDGKVIIAIAEIHEYDGSEWNPVSLSNDDEMYLRKYENELMKHPEISSLITVKRLPLLRWGNRYYSYNNCLAETPKGKKTVVYLPSFEIGTFEEGQPDFAKADQKVFDLLSSEDWGLDPKLVKFDFRSVAESSKAGLRCLTQVLRRSAE